MSLQQLLLLVPAVTTQQQQQHATVLPNAASLPAAAAGGVSHHFVAVVMMPTHSPSMDLMTAAAHLLARGHRVTVVSNQNELPQLQKFVARHRAQHPEEFTMNFIGFESPLKDFGSLVKKITGKDKQMKGSMAIMANLQHTLAGACQALLSNATAMQP